MQDIRENPRHTLPVILIAAVIQGWLLYFLHHAIVDKHWPATNYDWLLSLYALALFVPLTVQMLVRFVARRDLWLIVGAIAVAYCYFGWHHGSSVILRDELPRNEDGIFALGVEACVLWLMALPFVQARLLAGRWNAHYPTLFSTSWHNFLVLAEAAAFTGLFWLLLFLWGMLFKMLGIEFFRELFQEPIFVYPVTALTFGIALHLIGSIERLTTVVLDQVLSVLKWLAIVAAVILALFTVALVLKLPGLVVSGQRAIGAAWLLWLIAVIVLLFNAAYRDGTVAKPYPNAIAQMLRFVVPLTVIVALTALYAMLVRANHFGLTVERVWAFVVAGAAVIYAIGYSTTVFRSEGWLSGMARINVIASLVLMATIALALTPVLSPYRLAANSQYHRAQLPATDEPDGEQPYNRGWQSTPFQYLRFESGRYGIDRLQALTEFKEGSEAARVSKAARNALAQKDRGNPAAFIDQDAFVKALRVFPEGRSLDPVLEAALKLAVQAPNQPWAVAARSKSVGLFVDLDGDGRDEFVLISRMNGTVFALRDAGWQQTGAIYRTYGRDGWEDLTKDLESEGFEAVSPPWKDLKIGTEIFRVNPDTRQPPP